jgi:hypothetical protein
MSTGYLTHRRSKHARPVASGVVTEVFQECDGNAPVVAQGRIRGATLAPHPLAKPRHQIRCCDRLLPRNRNDPHCAQVLHEDPRARTGDCMKTGAVSGATAPRQVRQECAHSFLVQIPDSHVLSSGPNAEMHGVGDAPRANPLAVADLA